MKPELVAGVAGCVAGLSSLILLCRYRLILRREKGAFLDVIATHQNNCAAELEDLRKSLASLEKTAREHEPLPEGGLNRSRRADAVQLLRAGSPADVVAARLDMGMREIRLLANVTDLLSVQ